MHRAMYLVSRLSIIGILSVAVGVAGPWSPIEASTQRAAKPKFVLEDPCTYPARSAVKRAFGGKVTKEIPSGDILCYLDVGTRPSEPTIGRLAVIREYRPDYGFDTSRDKYEDKRAIEVLSVFEIVDVINVGKRAYLNRSTGALTVLADRKLVFTISWVPTATESSEPIESEPLERVARNIVARTRADR